MSWAHTRGRAGDSSHLASVENGNVVARGTRPHRTKRAERLDAIERRKQEKTSGRADFHLRIDHVADARVRRRYVQDAKGLAEVTPLTRVLACSPARRVSEQFAKIR